MPSLRIALAAAIVSMSPLHAQSDTGFVRRWRDDLAVLRREMPAKHANLFHDMTRVQFDSALTTIEQRLPSLARHQVIVELQKLAALVGDGHTNVGPWRDSLVAFHTLPIALYWFTEGIVVRAADSAHASLLGARVVAIGGVSIDSASARIRPLISRDNEMAYKLYTPWLLAMPEVLHALGVARDSLGAEFTLEKDGQRSSVMLTHAGRFPMYTGDADKSLMPRTGWVDAREAAAPAMWLADPTNIYSYTWLPAERTLYARINTIQQKAGDSLSAFMRRAIATADSARAERFVLDLRLNGGGNGDYNKSIFLPLIKSRYDVRGKLYVITGRRTFSAAQMLVTEMEKFTNATFVGEPTSSKANHFGDSFRIVLPNSRVTVRVSTLWHQYRDSRDKRPMVQPAVSAPLSFEDYMKGHDPALAAILRP